MPDEALPGGGDARPRLLVLASTYPRWPGDPEPGFVHELAKRLAAGFEVTVLGPHAPGAKPRERMDGVEVVRYRYAPQRLETLVNDGGIVTNLKRSRWKWLLVPSFVLAQAWVAWRLLRQRRIDVVHAHWLLPQGLIAALLQSLPGRKVPFVVTSHGADLYALRGGVLDAAKRFVLRRCAAATVVSSAMLDRLRAIGAPTGKVSVLSMGVDVSGRFRPDPGVERRADEILFVGRLVEKKGVAHLIRALPRVLAQRPSVRLAIAGFGPCEAQLREESQAAGVAAHVDFLGALPQSRLPELYQRAGVFVAPFVRAGSGDQEGLPVALMEAIGCGCPVIAGSVPGLQDLLGAHLSEVCVAPEDGERLAAMILDALENPQAAAARAALIRETAAAQVDWERIAAGYAALIQASIDHAPESHGR
jgi:glycosyltransferase involved in cell wall biosynthesis